MALGLFCGIERGYALLNGFGIKARPVIGNGQAEPPGFLLQRQAYRLLGILYGVDKQIVKDSLEHVRVKVCISMNIF